MNILLVCIAWCLLFVLCWPMALLVVVLFPLVWLLCLPFRIASAVLHAAFKIVFGLLSLPFRLFGFGRCQCHGHR